MSVVKICLNDVIKRYTETIRDIKKDSKKLDLTNSNDILNFKFEILNKIDEFDIIVDRLTEINTDENLDRKLEKIGQLRKEAMDIYSKVYGDSIKYRRLSSKYGLISSKAKLNTQYVGISGMDLKEKCIDYNHYGKSGSGDNITFGVSL